MEMSIANLVKTVAAAFSDQVANGTVRPEDVRATRQEFDFAQRLAEIVFELPPGTSLFHDGGDREELLTDGGKVLALYDLESDRWGWYLFSGNIYGDFSINPN